MTTLAGPSQILDHSPMNGFQIVVVSICILLNALDGFDVLAISFAAPGIADEWAISRAELGIVLAMELFGMAVGSVTLGGVADRLGRRPTILLCLWLMASGMYGASLVTSVNQLLIIRFVTGLGIGGMLASVTAMVAEFSNAKYRNISVVLMAVGYPLGAVVGGSISSVLLDSYDWRAIFVFGAICTASMLGVVWVCLPESIEYLSAKRPKNALERINKTLLRMGHEILPELPVKINNEQSSSFRVLFSVRFRALTLLLIVAYFMHIMTFYYILKWIPKIVVDMGYVASSAGSVLVWANVGGAVGSLCLGLLSARFRLRILLVVVFVFSFIMVTAFGFGQKTIANLSLVAAITGFFTNAGVVGIYALMVNVFPSDVRASGTGIVIGIGRGGAALGPIVAGLLFTAGFDLLLVSLVMGAGALVAAVVVFALGPVLKRHNMPANI